MSVYCVTWPLEKILYKNFLVCFDVLFLRVQPAWQRGNSSTSHRVKRMGSNWRSLNITLCYFTFKLPPLLTLRIRSWTISEFLIKLIGGCHWFGDGGNLKDFCSYSRAEKVFVLFFVTGTSLQKTQEIYWQGHQRCSVVCEYRPWTLTNLLISLRVYFEMYAGSICQGEVMNKHE